MFPPRRLHGWRAPGISTRCSISGFVGLQPRGLVSTPVCCCRYERSIKFMQFVFLFGSASLFSSLSAGIRLLRCRMHVRHPRRVSHTFRQQHSRGTFQLPRRRQIKQGCEGEIPPSPFPFEFVIACCGVAVCRRTLGSMK